VEMYPEDYEGLLSQTYEFNKKLLSAAEIF
jgi:hypothetical protein